MKRLATRFFDHFRKPVIEVVRAEAEVIRLAVGRAEARAVRRNDISDLRDAEFSVFSQFGEDGLIQFLVHRLRLREGRFVEIGVEDYGESNTRFLLQNDGWEGLIIDAGNEHLAFAHSLRIAWRYSLTAISAFVTVENVLGHLAQQGYASDVDLLSVDIDGSDYWVLNALSAVRPKIVVAEYNSIFGPSAPVSVPYDPAFDRSRAHWSWLYFGASLGALCWWGKVNGYDLVATNRGGNNAFFVRSDLGHDLRVLSAEEAYVASRFREGRDRDGRLSLIDPHTEGLRLIADLPLVDVRSGETFSVRQALEL